MSGIIRPGLQYPRLWICLALFIAAFITVTCLMPARDMPDIGTWDKLIHASSYVALAFCLGGSIQRRHFLWLVVALTAFGGLIELAQEAMQMGRHAEWADLLADFIGTVVGVALAATALGRWPGFIESLFRRVLA
ncbi:MAG: VanZ family protein [Pseudomonadota bacterium]